MVHKVSGLLICIICSFSAFGQTAESREWLLRQRLPEWANHSFHQLNLGGKYKISAYINPFYLEADFNGDQKRDIALAVEDKATEKKGFIILHGSGEEYFVCGAGKQLGNGSDDFSWMDIWKVHRDPDTHHTSFHEKSATDRSNPLKEKTPGIYAAKSESAGGLIYWDGQQYAWEQFGD